jgi:hypothetical protein
LETIWTDVVIQSWYCLQIYLVVLGKKQEKPQNSKCRGRNSNRKLPNTSLQLYHYSCQIGNVDFLVRKEPILFSVNIKENPGQKIHRVVKLFTER